MKAHLTLKVLLEVEAEVVEAELLVVEDVVLLNRAPVDPHLVTIANWVCACSSCHF